MPLPRSVLLDTYPKEKHGSAMDMWGVGGLNTDSPAGMHPSWYANYKHLG
ncbi:hypothetical protein [Flavobacterium sp. W21_SRS_FM6]